MFILLRYLSFYLLLIGDYFNMTKSNRYYRIMKSIEDAQLQQKLRGRPHQEINHQFTELIHMITKQFNRKFILQKHIILMPLTQERAEQRASCIKPESINYSFHVSLEQGNHYQGLAEIAFQLLNVPKQLHLDFRGTPSKLFLNSQETQIMHIDGFIQLDNKKLVQGFNSILVLYRNKYDNDGHGCASFVDIDQKQYLYTQFQAYEANKVFPVFDQPDLKAKMKLNAIIPRAWKKILSNQFPIIEKQFDNEQYTKNVKCLNVDLLNQFFKQKDGLMFLFPETKMLPTYLYCFVAGDYQQIKFQNPYKGIPMSIYSIQSLFPYLQNMASFIVQITIESLKFFESFFGYEFPFNKYDQIFVHEYNVGAMQNAGVVTFNDIYIQKDKFSTQKMLKLANTISHQLSHHWFGNLVTMKWWDDLWLNESFADFISHFCLQKIKNNLKTIHYESAMLEFLNRKAWGYEEDQRTTTHPIRGPIANTTAADAIFDGITYAKGASTMKQLLFIMKQQNFSKGLQRYFNKFAFKNARLEDFIIQMNQVKEGKFDLDTWRQLWLQKASLNVIQPFWDPKDTSIEAKLAIVQTPFTKDYPTLRPHKIKIGMFRQNCEVDVLETLIAANQRTVITFDGSNKYKAVVLNYEDYSFVKTIDDPASKRFFEQNLNKIRDSLTRGLIWGSFFDGVKDAKITTAKYIDILIKNIGSEPSDSIFDKQYSNVASLVGLFTPIKYREQLNNKLFKFTHDLLSSIDPNDENRKNRVTILKDNLISFAASQQNKKVLLAWRDQTYEHLKQHKMSITQNWRTITIAFTMSCLSKTEKEKIFEQLASKDKTDSKKLKRLTCDALNSSKQQFIKLYQSYQSPQNPLSVAMKRASVTGWNHRVHLDWLIEIKERFFKDIAGVIKQMDGQHLELFVLSLQPIDDDLQGNAAKYEALELQGDRLQMVKTKVKKIIHDMKKRAVAYKFFEQERLKL